MLGQIWPDEALNVTNTTKQLRNGKKKCIRLKIANKSNRGANEKFRTKERVEKNKIIADRLKRTWLEVRKLKRNNLIWKSSEFELNFNIFLEIYTLWYFAVLPKYTSSFSKRSPRTRINNILKSQNAFNTTKCPKALCTSLRTNSRLDENRHVRHSFLRLWTLRTSQVSVCCYVIVFDGLLRDSFVR